MHEAQLEPPSGFLELRHAATDHPIFVVVPERRLLVIEGAGLPEAADFRMATEVLRGVDATVRSRLRHDRFADGPKPVLEIAWQTTGMSLADIVKSFAEPRPLSWRQMLELPRTATSDAANDAIERVRRAAGRDVPLVRAIRYSEGRAAQLLHLGTVSTLAPTVARLFEFVAVAGFLPRGGLHQLAYADPDLVPAGRARSILRMPIE
ncbi:MAG TPA: hypothetical protein VGM49_09190 [Candidatus Limnocylindrales bacterium]|jgi:hypothetical protein